MQFNLTFQIDIQKQHTSKLQYEYYKVNKSFIRQHKLNRSHLVVYISDK